MAGQGLGDAAQPLAGVRRQHHRRVDRHEPLRQHGRRPASHRLGGVLVAVVVGRGDRDEQVAGATVAPVRREAGDTHVAAANKFSRGQSFPQRNDTRAQLDRCHLRRPPCRRSDETQIVAAKAAVPATRPPDAAQHPARGIPRADGENCSQSGPPVKTNLVAANKNRLGAPSHACVGGRWRPHYTPTLGVGMAPISSRSNAAAPPAIPRRGPPRLARRIAQIARRGGWGDNACQHRPGRW